MKEPSNRPRERIGMTNTDDASRHGPAAQRTSVGQQGRMANIRPLDAMDRVFLEEMLFEAFFWDPAWPRPTLAEFREHPEFTKLLADWGRPGDRGVVAEEQQSKTGAAWFRLWKSELHSYGFVNAETPELGIAVASAHRSKGVGRTLLRTLIEIARADGYPALSLSVSPSNYARLFYESEGFHKIGESGTSWTLLLPLDRAPAVAASSRTRK
jgi:ribosomal protein S18 acetylase RimI-like enzyme